MGRTSRRRQRRPVLGSRHATTSSGDRTGRKPTSGSRTGPRACTWTAWAAPPADPSAVSGAAPPTPASSGRRKLPEATPSSGTGRPGCTWTAPGGPTTAPTSSSTASSSSTNQQWIGVTRPCRRRDRDQDRARREQHQGRQRQRPDVQGVRPAQRQQHERAADGLQGPEPEQVRGVAPDPVRWTESGPDEREDRDGQRPEQLHRAGSGHHAVGERDAERQAASGVPARGRREEGEPRRSR